MKQQKYLKQVKITSYIYILFEKTLSHTYSPLHLAYTITPKRAQTHMQIKL